MNLASQPERAHLFQTPTVSGAKYWAREHAVARMQAGARSEPNADDSRFLISELARLLFQVEASDGGFLGLSDAQLEKRCGELAIPYELASDAAWHGAPPVWPGAVREAA